MLFIQVLLLQAGQTLCLCKNVFQSFKMSGRPQAFFAALHQAHAKLLQIVDSVTLEEVNAIGASVLSYISHYQNEAALLEEVGPDPTQQGYAHPGPTRMTSIVACVPAFMDASGQSTGGHAYQHACTVSGLCLKATHCSECTCLM